MTALRQAPVPMPTSELADLLAQMAEAVRSGDSLEGFVEYSIPDPDETPHVDPLRQHMVKASVRTGNRMGQGGMIMLGKLADVTPGLARGELDRAVRTALPLAGGQLRDALEKLRTVLDGTPTTIGRAEYDPDFADRLENGGYDHG
jgi:hypothetical protein